MAEKSAEELMAAQLEYDSLQASVALERTIQRVPEINAPIARAIVSGIEALIGKVVIRWWFERIKRNRENVKKEIQKEVEARRRARAATLIACCQAINAKTGVPQQGPSNLELQMAVLDLTGAVRALWQVVIDAGILDPNTKQDYLDAGVAEIFNQVEQHGATLAPAPARGGASRRN